MKEHPAAEVEELDDAVILPGLVNAHTHLELSDCVAGDSPGGSYTDWILTIRQRMRGGMDETVDWAAATRRGVEQCLRFGVTCVGDITKEIDASRRVLAASGLRGVSFGEVLGLGKLRERFEQSLPRAIDSSHATRRLRIGLTPHAPYTVDLAGYEQSVKLAKRHGLPLATHLAETPDERVFLEERGGAFREIWDRLGMWDEAVRTYHGGPIHMARAVGLLEYPTLLAHVNYCDDEEMGLLAEGLASVVYCPRTHAYFGHPPHGWREMLAAGINVAVGTDSCASSPDLNLVEELRLLHRIAPEVPVQTLWEMGTTRAARAIRWEDQVGSLAAGKAADVVVFDAPGENPLRAILELELPPRRVWVGGVEQLLGSAE